jgi:1,2-dihydroxy-3-keto-5-methylthiopentene dioxygenase
MAILRIPSEDRVIRDAVSIREFLQPYGIHYDRWPVAGRIDRDASQEEILAAYEPEVTALKERGGYITADVVNVTPEVPNLQEMLDKFNQEHRHAEDEVRFIVKGRGIFYIHPENGDPVYSIEVEEGDLINVPAGTKHWFDLCADRYHPRHPPLQRKSRLDPALHGRRASPAATNLFASAQITSPPKASTLSKPSPSPHDRVSRQTHPARHRRHRLAARLRA